MKEKVGIYIHIPFCEKKCDYCNFVSFKCSEKQKEEYVFLLLKEIEMQKPKLKDYIIDSIFIGGGTPSCLRNNAIKNILNYITNDFEIDPCCEITVEANPNSLTEEKLTEYKLAGVNRLSIGLQAYNDKLLKLIGRLHTKKQFDNAIKTAKNIGFDNISADILLGLPKQKMSDVIAELKHLAKLNLTHISAYGLIVEENTKLFKNLENKVYSLPKEEKSVKMYEKTLKYLRKKGYQRYEVSNFCKPTFESKHNLKYWSLQEYIGFGVASHSFFDGERWENYSTLSEYKNSIENNKLPQKQISKETIEDLKEEYIMTALRKEKGIDLIKYEKMFDEDLLLIKQSEIVKLFNQKMISYEQNRLFATDKGFEFLNQIILELV